MFETLTKLMNTYPESNTYLPTYMMNGPSHNSINLKQARLQEDLKVNKKACQEVQNAVQSIVLAAINSRKYSDESEDDSELTVIDCSRDDDTMSLDSIKAISTDEECIQSNEERIQSSEEVEEDIPGLNKLLKLLSQGKIQLSEEIMKQLNDLSTKTEANTKTSIDLQERGDQLKRTVEELGKKIESTDQYIKFDNLLLHKFPKPPTKLSSLQFSFYIADLINHFLPYLPVPVHWSHISDAHQLKTKSNRSNVIIVRFCNRNIRHMIFDNRFHLTQRGLAITEHLTEGNLEILKKAKELFGFHNVFTEKCNVIIDANGKSRKMNTLIDVYELFESIYAEPHDSSYSSSINNLPNSLSNPISNHTAGHAHGRIGSRNTNNAPIATRSNTRGRGRGHRGRGNQGRSSGYSVYNRSY